jgi:hypothetical protein
LDGIGPRELEISSHVARRRWSASREQGTHGPASMVIATRCHAKHADARHETQREISTCLRASFITKTPSFIKTSIRIRRIVQTVPRRILPPARPPEKPSLIQKAIQTSNAKNLSIIVCLYIRFLNLPLPAPHRPKISERSSLARCLFFLHIPKPQDNLRNRCSHCVQQRIPG